MKWLKFRIKTVTEAEDIIISTLYDIGLEGAQIEDKVPLSAWEKEQMFVDILPEGPEDDGIAYLNFFVEEDGEVSAAELLCRIHEELDGLREFMDIGEGTVEIAETEDVDWINNWKQYFHQFTIDDVLVIPSWEEVEQCDQDKIILHIDPGTAFGTGMHDTTQLCIRQLRKYITPETVLLDVGTGNIITEKEVQDRVGYGCYDIVVANILAEVLVSLTPVIVSQLKKGGIYITSGIIDDKEDTVREAVEAAGLEILEVTYQGEWVSVTAQKN